VPLRPVVLLRKPGALSLPFDQGLDIYQFPTLSGQISVYDCLLLPSDDQSLAKGTISGTVKLCRSSIFFEAIQRSTVEQLLRTDVRMLLAHAWLVAFWTF
jgi:hypothetical protein